MCYYSSISILSKRCLVVVDGFFEWRHLNNKSYHYHISLTNHRPFALAGIWDKWQNPDTGIESLTFSVITTEANSLMAQIHNTKKSDLQNRFHMIFSLTHQ